jgi:hypothetical protein
MYFLLLNLHLVNLSLNLPCKLGVFLLDWALNTFILIT